MRGAGVSAWEKGRTMTHPVAKNRDVCENTLNKIERRREKDNDTHRFISIPTHFAPGPTIWRFLYLSEESVKV
jgi:hypothetical protein